MTIQTAPVPPEALETAKQSRKRVGVVVLMLLLIGATAAIALGYRGSQPENSQTYSNEQLQAMAELILPGQYERVDSTWGCTAHEQSACFTSSLTGLKSVEALSSAMGASEYSTRPSSGVFPASYNFCTNVGSATAQVNISGLPSNAIEQGGLWIVPSGEDPQINGTAVTVILTGPETCP